MGLAPSRASQGEVAGSQAIVPGAKKDLAFCAGNFLLFHVLGDHSAPVPCLGFLPP